MVNILYVTFTGLLEPLGQSQVWKYLEKLSNEHQYWLITFEKGKGWHESDTFSQMAEQCEQVGIQWVPLDYYRRPPGVSIPLNLTRAIYNARKIVRANKIDLVHARGHPPSIVALDLLRRHGIPFLFDMRGFNAELYVELGRWKANGPLYRILSHIDERSISNSSGTVCLTERAAAFIQANRNGERLSQVHTIPTCVDLSQFKISEAKKRRGGFVLGYVGSASGRYRFDDALDCFKHLKKKVSNARFLIINRSDHHAITQKLSDHRLNVDDFELIASEHHEMAKHIGRMDAAVFLYPDSVSSMATSPTKMGELLACGIPCLTNSAVGDAEEILEKNQVGVVLKENTQEARIEAIKRLLELTKNPDIRIRCRATAENLFNLEDGVKTYNSIYWSALQASN